MPWNLDSLLGPLARTPYRSAGEGEEPYVDYLAESYIRAHPDPDEFNGGVILATGNEHDGTGEADLDGHHEGWPQNGMRLLASSGEAPEQSSTSDSGQPQPSQPAENSTSGDAGPAKGTVPLPPHLQWANDSGMLSTHLEAFMKRNPLNPSNAPKEVRDIYGNMQAPGSNFGPPHGNRPRRREVLEQFLRISRAVRVQQGVGGIERERGGLAWRHSGGWTRTSSSRCGG